MDIEIHVLWSWTNNFYKKQNYICYIWETMIIARQFLQVIFHFYGENFQFSTRGAVSYNLKPTFTLQLIKLEQLM